MAQEFSVLFEHQNHSGVKEKKKQNLKDPCGLLPKRLIQWGPEVGT